MTLSSSLPVASLQVAIARLNGLRTSTKAWLVAGGYVIALLLAAAATAVRVLSTNGPVAQASSGMYAFGDAVVFVGAFGVGALVPTGLALLFLRSRHTLWGVLASVGVGVALTGVAAAIVFMIGRQQTVTALATWAALSVLRILISPLFALMFCVGALFAPNRGVRLALVAAIAWEAAVTAMGGVVWFLPLLTSR